jgi:AcrR family transcriptional regulator
MRVRTEAKRQAILAVAGDLFLKGGYAGTSMAQIAAEVGGSKTTLYGYFPSKAAVFSAFVAETGARLFKEIEALDLGGLDLPAALGALGAVYLRLLLSPAAIDLHRVVIAEAGRFPELGQLFFESGRRQTVDRVAKTLAALAITHDRPSLASSVAVTHFRGLIEAGLYERRLLGGEVDLSADVDAAVSAAVACFLSGCG